MYNGTRLEGRARTEVHSMVIVMIVMDDEDEDGRLYQTMNIETCSVQWIAIGI